MIDRLTRRWTLRAAGLALLASLSSLLPACGGDDSSTGSAPSAGSFSTPSSAEPNTGGVGKLRIAVVPKGTTHEHWKAVHAGAQRAADELGVEIIWQGPEREDDRNQQIQLVNNLVASKVDAIVLAPLDSVALVEPVKRAAAAGIPVVIFDSGLEAELGKDYISYVATDNYEGGRKAGQRMAELLPSGSKIILLRYAVGSASTEEREKGFIEVVKAAGLDLVSDNQYAGATVNTAFEKAQSLLLPFQVEAGLSVAGIHCPNESSTFGMLRALERANLTGKVTFVGFDVSPKLLEALEAGHIHGLVVQDPINMGYQGVATAVKALRKEPYETHVDTGSKMVTKENLAEPEVQRLVHPPIR